MGAVRFVQRFGSTLNAHVHFHCWVIDGVFVAGANGQVQFAAAAALRPEDLAAVQQPLAATGAAFRQSRSPMGAPSCGIRPWN
jgi:Putative transposase